MENGNSGSLRKAAFTREDTRAIKGLAVMLMLLHHLATWGDRWPMGFAGFKSLWSGFVDQGFLMDLAFNAILCVPIFFFLGVRSWTQAATHRDRLWRYPGEMGLDWWLKSAVALGCAVCCAGAEYWMLPSLLKAAAPLFGGR